MPLSSDRRDPLTESPARPVSLHQRDGEDAPHPHLRKGDVGLWRWAALAFKLLGAAGALFMVGSCGAKLIGFSASNATDKLEQTNARIDATNRRVDSLIVTRLADGKEQRAEVARLNRWVVGLVKMGCLDERQREAAYLVDVPCDSLVGARRGGR